MTPASLPRSTTHHQGPPGPARPARPRAPRMKGRLRPGPAPPRHPLRRPGRAASPRTVLCRPSAARSAVVAAAGSSAWPACSLQWEADRQAGPGRRPRAARAVGDRAREFWSIPAIVGLAHRLWPAGENALIGLARRCPGRAASRPWSGRRASGSSARGCRPGARGRSGGAADHALGTHPQQHVRVDQQRPHPRRLVVAIVVFFPVFVNVVTRAA